jgi:hypothetical protein
MALQKKYRIENREKIVKYRLANRERFNALRREQIQCECGCFITRGTLSRHRTSKKHI